MAIPAKMPEGHYREVHVGSLRLPGYFLMPDDARGIVLFAHGSGSSRHSSRNTFVAESLYRNGLGSLLFDLLLEDEAADRKNVFDIDLLADRLDDAKTWLARRPEAIGMPFGYFGASTGAGAALVAASRSPANIYAVVSRGGRPDLAGSALEDVRAATLLIVGGADDNVIELNRNAMRYLSCKTELEIIPGASHLFPEPGALERVARLANAWFLKYF